MSAIVSPDDSSYTTLGTDRPRPPRRGRLPTILIDSRPLAREYLGRWLREASPGTKVISLGSPSELLASGQPLDTLQLIVFSIGAKSVKDADILGKMTLLRRRMGRTPLVLLSDRDDVDSILEALEHGVRGYIPTNSEPPEAAAALQCVEAGGTFVPASALIRLAQDRLNGSRHTRDGEINPLQSLTPREREVLARLRQGKQNKIIAHELKIAESTVKVFVRRILSKLHASNRTEVAGQKGSELHLAS